MRGEADREAARGVVGDAELFISGVTMTAPRMPVAITSTAVSGGGPPSLSMTAIATAAVIDFGASDDEHRARGAEPLGDRERRHDRDDRADDERRRDGQKFRLTSASCV